MLKTTLFTLVFSATYLTTVQAASPELDGETLVQERYCYGCHSLTETLIGPSYQSIATLHRARKDIMVEILANKIILGGAGNWGVVPMVPNEHVSMDEARIIADWILNLGS